ncbi:hypothetical protein DSO57_1019994 [Entomophthora muscae]|uniref:Uncharacterized protein n=1 Tax=Entomophthora muscae TaxID=34485 RepID=A0ACC2STB2_9FUNG|nr:hypothetical protein DSO57_1019994 [Entomophthora muscae]
MFSPVTPCADYLQDLGVANETMFIQLFGVMYIMGTGLVNSMVSTSGPWSLLGWSLSYIIMLVPILWWVLPTGPEVPLPMSATAPCHTWLPGITQGTEITPSLEE